MFRHCRGSPIHSRAFLQPKPKGIHYSFLFNLALQQVVEAYLVTAGASAVTANNLFILFFSILQQGIVSRQNHMGLQPSPAQKGLKVEQLPPGPGQNPDLAVGYPWTPLYPCPVLPHTYKDTATSGQVASSGCRVPLNPPNPSAAPTPCPPRHVPAAAFLGRIYAAILPGLLLHRQRHGVLEARSTPPPSVYCVLYITVCITQAYSESHSSQIKSPMSDAVDIRMTW